MEYNQNQDKSLGVVRQLVDTITTESTGRLDKLIIDTLRQQGLDLEVTKTQTGLYTGKTVIKAYELI